MNRTAVATATLKRIARARRGSYVPVIKRLVEKGFQLSRIAEVLTMSPNTVQRIAKEHGIVSAQRQSLRRGTWVGIDWENVDIVSLAARNSVSVAHVRAIRSKKRHNKKNAPEAVVGYARTMATPEPCGYCGSTDGVERCEHTGWNMCSACGGI